MDYISNNYVCSNTVLIQVRTIHRDDPVEVHFDKFLVVLRDYKVSVEGIDPRGKWVNSVIF